MPRRAQKQQKEKLLVEWMELLFVCFLCVWTLPSTTVQPTFSLALFDILWPHDIKSRFLFRFLDFPIRSIARIMYT